LRKRARHFEDAVDIVALIRPARRPLRLLLTAWILRVDQRIELVHAAQVLGCKGFVYAPLQLGAPLGTERTCDLFLIVEMRHPENDPEQSRVDRVAVTPDMMREAGPV